MSHESSRRSFLVRAATLAAAPAVLALPARADSTDPAGGAAIPAGFPRVDAATVETFVTLAHRDPAEVRRMLERQPALARAAWDWGFGDWETALGAAAHTGGREIAEMLLERGASPTIFSAAMLGQLDLVKAMVAAMPGIQGAPGPHGLTLLHHARVGGQAAEPVVEYLVALGGADEKPALRDLGAAERESLVGGYRFGPGQSERFEVDVRKDLLGIQRPGWTRRILHHLGDLAFYPSGVPSVRIAFESAGGRVARLSVTGLASPVVAKREG